MNSGSMLIRAIACQQEARMTELKEPSVKCPAHGETVGVKDGKLVGRCSRCAGEAALALLALETV